MSTTKQPNKSLCLRDGIKRQKYDKIGIFSKSKGKSVSS